MPKFYQITLALIILINRGSRSFRPWWTVAIMRHSCCSRRFEHPCLTRKGWCCFIINRKSSSTADEKNAGSAGGTRSCQHGALPYEPANSGSSHSSTQCPTKIENWRQNCKYSSEQWHSKTHPLPFLKLTWPLKINDLKMSFLLRGPPDKTVLVLRRVNVSHLFVSKIDSKRRMSGSANSINNNQPQDGGATN